MISSNIRDRTTSTLGVSIGTGLALETLFDIEPFDKNRTPPPKHNPEDYAVHIYNIYTLFRNVVNSIKYKDKDILVSNKSVQEQLLNDIYNIMAVYENVKTNIVFYLPDYTKDYKRFNKGKDNSVYRPYTTYTFMKQNIEKLKYPVPVLKGDLKSVLPRSNTKVLILTHFTLDLLHHETTNGLCLLESHTGKVKTRVEFGGKYHAIGRRDLSILPMNPKLLWMLGDMSIVKPLGIADRKAIYEIAKVKLWTPAMSKYSLEKELKKFNNKIPV